MLFIIDRPSISQASQALINAAAHADVDISLVLIGDGVYAMDLPFLADKDVAILASDARGRGITISENTKAISGQAFAHLSTLHTHWITL